MKAVESIKELIVNVGDFLDLPIIKEEIKIEHPVDTSFGDYSSNISLVLSKQAKLNPREVANKIKKEILKQDRAKEFIEKIEVAGAGFINFYLKTEYLIQEAETINYENEFRAKLNEYGQGKTMVIDYSAPNIAKPFGIGHLRSTDIGQSIYNIYKLLGWNCIGDNHLGDWGTQFGKLIVAIKKWNKKDLTQLTINDLEDLYVKFHQEAEKNEELVNEGREWFERLEKGDKNAREIWQKCVDISLLEFDRVYQLLGVHIDFVHGESFYEEMLPGIIDEIENKGISKKSEGAVIIEFQNMPPAMVKKSNGTTTYFTRDMATVKYRLKTWKPDLIIYEVGTDQQLHFKQLFEAVKMMGWTDSELVHVAHGLIRWPRGKFSTRKGDTIHLSNVIDKAIEKATEIADQNKINKEMTASERNQMINSVAIGAVKFSDLSTDPRRDVIFDWDKIMSLEGNSGPYLQYTYARGMSVLDKTQIKEQKNINGVPVKIEPEEMALIREFCKFEEKIVEAAMRFSPAVVAEYLLSVARKYNEFYAKNRIIGEKEEVFRVFLTRTMASVLETGLWLLGIETVEKM